MKRLTAENIVDAYEWSAMLAVEVSKESQSDVNRDMAYNLRDALREYLILLLTIERKEVSELVTTTTT